MNHFSNLLIISNILLTLTGCSLNSTSYICVEVYDYRANLEVKLFDLNELNKQQLTKLSSIIEKVYKKNENAHKNIVFAMPERSNMYQLYIVTYNTKNEIIAKEDLSIDSKTKEIFLSHMQWLNDFDYDYQYTAITNFFTKEEISKLMEIKVNTCQ